MLGWETAIDVDLFRVLGQKPPTLVDPMQLADRFVTRGRVGVAREIYQDVLAATADKARIAEANNGIKRCDQAQELEHDRKNLLSACEASNA